MNQLEEKLQAALTAKELPSFDELSLLPTDGRPQSERIIAVLERAGHEFISRKTLIRAAHLHNKYISGGLVAAKRRVVIIDKKIGEETYYRLGYPGEGELLAPKESPRDPDVKAKRVSIAEGILDFLAGHDDWLPGPKMMDALKITYPQLRMALKDSRLKGRVESKILNGHRAFRIKVMPKSAPGALPTPTPSVPQVTPPAAPAPALAGQWLPARPNDGSTKQRILDYLQSRDWTPINTLLADLRLSSAQLRGGITWPVNAGLIERRSTDTGTEYRLNPAPVAKPRRARTQAETAPDAAAETSPPVTDPVTNPVTTGNPAGAGAGAGAAPTEAAPAPADLPVVLPATSPTATPALMQQAAQFWFSLDMHGQIVLTFNGSDFYVLTETHQKQLRNMFELADLMKESKA